MDWFSELFGFTAESLTSKAKHNWEYEWFIQSGEHVQG
jgi:hypothetical protein